MLPRFVNSVWVTETANFFEHLTGISLELREFWEAIR